MSFKTEFDEMRARIENFKENIRYYNNQGLYGKTALEIFKNSVDTLEKIDYYRKFFARSLPNGVMVDYFSTSIGAYAYRGDGGYSGLTKLKLVAIESTARNSLANSYNLIELDLGEECSTIANQTVTKTTTNPPLERLIVRSHFPPYLGGSSAFSNCIGADTKIYVRKGMIPDYESASNWESFRGKFYELNEDGSIPE